MYDRIYYATSRTVHFNVIELLRRTWFKKGEPISVTSNHYERYWASFALAWVPTTCSAGAPTLTQPPGLATTTGMAARPSSYLRRKPLHLLSNGSAVCVHAHDPDVNTSGVFRPNIGKAVSVGYYRVVSLSSRRKRAALLKRMSRFWFFVKNGASRIA